MEKIIYDDTIVGLVLNPLSPHSLGTFADGQILPLISLFSGTGSPVVGEWEGKNKGRSLKSQFIILLKALIHPHSTLAVERANQGLRDS